MDRQVAVRTSRETLRQFAEFHLLQEEFITYRTKVELAVTTLREVAKQLHALEIKKVKHKKDGYITATFGSGLAGTALVGGILTTGPFVTAGLFVGTVLSSAGALIVWNAGEKKEVAGCQEKVNNILQDLEAEFAKCVARMRRLYGEDMDVEELGNGVGGVQGGHWRNHGEQGRGLHTVDTIIRNIHMYATEFRQRLNELPADLRGTIEDGLSWITCFLSPAGAARFVNLFRSETSLPDGGGLLQGSPSPGLLCSAPSVPDVPEVNTPVNPRDAKNTYFSSCGKFGKVMYTAGAVMAAWEFYNSITKAGELNKKLQRLRDSSDLLKYEGAAKEVFNISLDLQMILGTVFREDEEDYTLLTVDD